MQGDNGSNGSSSNGNGHGGNGHSNGKNGQTKTKPHVVRLHPRPRLPSEYAQKLYAEREQISVDRKPNALVSRLEKLAEIIDADIAAIPLHLEEEDSLVIKVDEALAKNGTNGRH